MLLVLKTTHSIPLTTTNFGIQTFQMWKTNFSLLESHNYNKEV